MNGMVGWQRFARFISCGGKGGASKIPIQIAKLIRKPDLKGASAPTARA